jgi:hypothetical protein
VDKFIRRSASPIVGQGRRKDKNNYTRPQVEEKDNGHHGAHQRGVGYDETIGRAHHCANMEKGASGSNGTSPRESGKIHHTGRGS